MFETALLMKIINMNETMNKNSVALSVLNVFGMSKKRISRSHGTPPAKSWTCVTKLFQVSVHEKTCSGMALIILCGTKSFLPLFLAIPNIVFYFCAISTQEKKKGSINDESEDSKNEQELSGVPSTCSQQCLDGTWTRINKALWPAITWK